MQCDEDRYSSEPAPCGVNREFLLRIRKIIYQSQFGHRRRNEGNLLFNQVAVAPTRLPNCDFSGLFACGGNLRKDSVVCVYVGDWLRTVEALRRKDKSYLMRLGEQSYIDAGPHEEVAARYINDCVHPAGWNVKFVKMPELGCALVVALRDIMVGEELFVDYGRRYWRGVTPAPVRMTFLSIEKQLQSLRKGEIKYGHDQ